MLEYSSPGSKNIFAPPSTKTAKFKVKNEGKCRTLLLLLLLFLFDINHISAVTAYEKVTRDGSNNLGIWAQNPQPPEANRVERIEPPMLWRFFQFFPKNKAFYTYFGLNFCLKTSFLMTAKCVVDAFPRTLLQALFQK